MDPIPYGKQSISEEDIAAVSSVLRSDRLTQGPEVRAFEEALCESCGAGHCVVVSSGTMALHLACLALGVGPGDIGLTSPVSFMASANCIAYCGGRPDFVDIDPKNLCLSPEKVEAYCETKGIPKVVIPVDFAGIPADLARFRELSGKYGFRLIEDAAHSIGSVYDHNGDACSCGCCAHTDMAVFSFHPVKTITAGEGGAVLTNDDGLARRVRRLANHGIERNPSMLVNRGDAPLWYHEMQELGFNARITDIQCALGRSQLRRLHAFRAERQRIVRAYNRALEELESREVVKLPPWPEHTDPCYHLYTLRLGRRCAIHRDDLFHKLKEKGIHCQIHYIPIYRQPFYAGDYGDYPERFPEAEAYYASCISLPLFPGLDERSFHYIIDALYLFLG